MRFAKLQSQTTQTTHNPLHSKLIFDSAMEAVSYINSNKQMVTFGLEKLEETGISTVLYDLLFYSYQLIVTLHANMKPMSGITGQMI